MTESTFKTNDGRVITPEMVKTPDTAIQLLILASNFAFKKDLFTEMNDIAVVDKSRKMAAQYASTERYIREHYSNMILETKETDDEGKVSVKTTVITDAAILESFTSTTVTDGEKLSMELVEVPQLPEGVDGTYFVMLNSFGWRLQPGQVVLRVNGRVHIPLDSLITNEKTEG